MDSDLFYDAINAFKYSDTGKGKAQIHGEPNSYIARYRAMAPAVVKKLWELYAKEEFGFVKFEDKPGYYTQGSASVGNDWFDPDIKINVKQQLKISFLLYDLKKGNLPIHVKKQISGDFSANLAVISSIMVHEAIHKVFQWSYLDEEMVCRTMEVCYYQNLLKGISIVSKKVGKKINVAIPPKKAFGDLLNMNDLFRKKQLIDYVLSMETYRRSLNAAWIRKSFSWWGGIKNRKPKTKGFYIETLTKKHARCADTDLILQILESISKADWQKEIRSLCNIQNLRESLKFDLYSNKQFRRIEKVQNRLGINLGIK